MTSRPIGYRYNKERKSFGIGFHAKSMLLLFFSCMISSCFDVSSFLMGSDDDDDDDDDNDDADADDDNNDNNS